MSLLTLIASKRTNAHRAYAKALLGDLAERRQEPNNLLSVVVTRANDKHWPAGTDGGKGGQFAPKDDSSSSEGEFTGDQYEDINGASTAAEIEKALSHYGATPLVVNGKQFDGVFVTDKYIIDWDGSDYASITEKEEWVRDADPEKFFPDYSDKWNEDFWSSPPVLYHATTDENADEIDKEGIAASNRTRGMTNRGVGAAVFTTTEPSDLLDEAYGKVVYEIDTGAMAHDGVKLYASEEPDIVDYNLRGGLAAAVGLENWEQESEAGISPNTVILGGGVPAKYLKRIPWDEMNRASRSVSSLLNVVVLRAGFDPNELRDDRGRWAHEAGEPSESVELEPEQEDFKALVDIAKKNGGFTFHILTQHLVSPQSNFVSPYPQRCKVIPVKDLKADDLAAFVPQNFDLLTKPYHFFGVWIDEGKAYLDVSIATKSDAAAEKLCLESDQKAFFCGRTGKTVFVNREAKSGQRGLKNGIKQKAAFDPGSRQSDTGTDRGPLRANHGEETNRGGHGERAQDARRESILERVAVKRFNPNHYGPGEKGGQFAPRDEGVTYQQDLSESSEMSAAEFVKKVLAGDITTALNMPGVEKDAKAVQKILDENQSETDAVIKSLDEIHSKWEPKLEPLRQAVEKADKSLAEFTEKVSEEVNGATGNVEKEDIIARNREQGMRLVQEAEIAHQILTNDAGKMRSEALDALGLTGGANVTWSVKTPSDVPAGETVSSFKAKVLSHPVIAIPTAEASVFVSKFLDGSVLDEKVTFFPNSDSDRSATSPSGEIMLGLKHPGDFGAGSAALIHELGHVSEFRNQSLGRAAVGYLYGRVKHDPDGIVKIRDVVAKINPARAETYGEHELIVKDQFESPTFYAGRIYPRLEGQPYPGTEILSMGYERMYRDAAAFAKEDPGHFGFTLNVMRGRFSKFGQKARKPRAKKRSIQGRDGELDAYDGRLAVRAIPRLGDAVESASPVDGGGRAGGDASRSAGRDDDQGDGVLHARRSHAEARAYSGWLGGLIVKRFNPNHYPEGTEGGKGGQFAPAEDVGLAAEGTTALNEATAPLEAAMAGVPPDYEEHSTASQEQMARLSAMRQNAIANVSKLEARLLKDEAPVENPASDTSDEEPPEPTMFMPEDWDLVPDDEKDKAFEDWKESNKEEWESSEWDSWTDDSDTVMTAGFQAFHDEPSEWSGKALDVLVENGVNVEQMLKDTGLSADELADKLITMNDGENWKDKDPVNVFDSEWFMENAVWDTEDGKPPFPVPEPVPEGQQDLPGIEHDDTPFDLEATDWYGTLNAELNDRLAGKINELVIDEGPNGEHGFGYGPDSIEEGMSDYWSEMGDKEKFDYWESHFAKDFEKDNWDEIHPDQKQGDTSSDEESPAFEQPANFDVIDEPDSSNKNYAKTLQLEHAREIFRERGLDPDDAKMLDDSIWKSWKSDSHNSQSILFQVAAGKELGLPYGTPRMSKEEMETNYWNGLEAREKANYQAYVRATWETSQFLLDRAGVHELELYRGIMMPKDVIDRGDFQLINADYPSDLKFVLYPDLGMYRGGASSWTLNRDVANSWGGVGWKPKGESIRIVARAVAPPEAVIGLPVYGKNIHGEREVVLNSASLKWWEVWGAAAPPFTFLDPRKSRRNKDGFFKGIISKNRKGEVVTYSMDRQVNGQKNIVGAIDLMDQDQTGKADWLNKEAGNTYSASPPSMTKEEIKAWLAAHPPKPRARRGLSVIGRVVVKR